MRNNKIKLWFGRIILWNFIFCSIVDLFKMKKVLEILETNQEVLLLTTNMRLEFIQISITIIALILIEYCYHEVSKRRT